MNWHLVWIVCSLLGMACSVTALILSFRKKTAAEPKSTLKRILSREFVTTPEHANTRCAVPEFPRPVLQAHGSKKEPEAPKHKRKYLGKLRSAGADLLTYIELLGPGQRVNYASAATAIYGSKSDRDQGRVRRMLILLMANGEIERIGGRSSREFRIKAAQLPLPVAAKS